MISAVHREPAVAVLASAAAALLAVILLYPLAIVLREGMIGDRGFDPSPVVRVLASPVPRTVVGNTLTMGLLAGLLGTLLGFAFALAAGRAARGWVRTILHYSALLPLIAPPFALALSTVFLFGRQGLVTRQLLGLDVNPYGLSGLLFV